MIHREIPQLTLSGNAREIGLQHGRGLRKQILSQISLYKELFQKTCKLSYSDILSIAGSYRETIARLTPEFLDEMEGIVAGVNENADAEATISLGDIVAMNSRSEITMGEWSDDRCTSLGWNTPGEDQILAQNWDKEYVFGPNLAMLRIEKEGKPTIFMVAEPGIIGKIGYNSTSVGACLNALNSKPTRTDLLPVHLLLRLSLESPSMAAAIEAIERSGGCASTQHILLADPTGSVGLEVSPNGTSFVREDEHGIVLHTNHVLIQNPANIELSTVPEDSRSRLSRAREICDTILTESELRSSDSLKDKLIPEYLRSRLFSDTFNAPRSISCAQQPEKGLIGETLFNIIMVLRPGSISPTAEVVFGRPGSEMESQVFKMPW